MGQVDPNLVRIPLRFGQRLLARLPAKPGFGPMRFHVWLLLLMGLAVVPALACGTISTQFPIESAAPPSAPTNTPLPTSTPIVIPTPAPSDPSGLGGATGPEAQEPERTQRSQVPLVVGERARVIARDGVRLRSEASREAAVVAELPVSSLALVVDGPFVADGFFWWRVEVVGSGQTGFVAEGWQDAAYLEVAGHEQALVDRAPRVGDTVEVVIRTLNLRQAPSVSATLITALNLGTRMTVQEGPRAADDYQWYEVRTEVGNLTGWAVVAAGNVTTYKVVE